MFPFQNEVKESVYPEDHLTWTQQLIIDLGLRRHPEGGYYAETDRSPLSVHNPLPRTSNRNDDTLDGMRPTSTSIYYLLDTARPNGFFHRNASRTIHSLHEGYGVYLLLYPPGHPNPRTAGIQDAYNSIRRRRDDGKLATPLISTSQDSSSTSAADASAASRGSHSAFQGYERRTLANGWTLEKFGVGRNFGVYQWLVEGDIYKASFLLDFDSSFGYIQPEKRLVEGTERRDGLFITEVVSPGFEFADHDFMAKGLFSEIFDNKELKAEFRSLLKP